MRYEEIVTFDLETGTTKLNKRGASHLAPENYIVASGFKFGPGKTFGDYYTQRTPVNFPDLHEAKLLVGQNIKFDLLWTWEHPELQGFIKSGGVIWDTQLAEYLISGMVPSSHMASMNQMVERYGGTLKIDAVKEMWEAGIDTPDIPKDLLMKYLLGSEEDEIDGDVNNTWIIFLGQLARIRTMHPNTMAMMKNRMESLLATTEMEFNGLHIDIELGNELREKVKKELDELDAEMLQYLPEFPPEFKFNWNSIYHKSYLIYGGTARYDKWVQHRHEETDELLYANKTEKWPLYANSPTDPMDDNYWGLKPDVYKSGKRVGQIKTRNVTRPDFDKPKGKIQDHFFKFDGYTNPDNKWKSTLTDGEDKPIYSTSSDIITILGTRDIPFLKNLSTRQKLSKDLGTYYWDEDDKGNRKGMLTLVNATTGCIHHSLNHTQTVTSRMSSSNPNGQNIPRKDNSEVKSVFTSRFGKDGRIVELDYSSLEVVVQAILTGDNQLVADLLNGVDFHTKRLAMKLNEDYDSLMVILGDDTHPRHKEIKLGRTKIKAFTFQRAYGAGAYKIAESTGIPLEDVERMIELEDMEYAGVQQFDKMLEAAINNSIQPTGKHIFVAGGKHEIHTGHWYSPTGTKFVWEEHETPEFLHKKGKFVGFSPTERKNYPPQGIGGEIVQTMLGLVYRWLLANDFFDGKVKLINTVHDSIYLDMHKSMVEVVVPTIKLIMEAVPRKYKKDFDLDFPVPFPVEADVGLNMYATMGYDTYIQSELNK